MSLRGGYDDAFYPRLAALEARNFWFRARNRLLLRLLQRHGGAVRDYLEVGCGTGYVLSAVAARFPEWRTIGSELLGGSLGLVRGRVPGARLLRSDARALPFTASLDAIGAFDVLEHIDDDRGALRSLHGALRPGGIVVLSVPQHRWLWSRQDAAAHHVRRYARGELEARVREAGFAVLWSSSFNSLLLPLMALSRLLPEGRGEFDPLRELALPRVVDALLHAVLVVEGWLLAAGLRLPAGGSRVVVARKEDDR